jgi:hypothetical protein
MATKKKVEEKEKAPEKLTWEEIESTAQLCRAKMNNPKKALQEEGRQELMEMHVRLKAQKSEPDPSWGK